MQISKFEIGHALQSGDINYLSNINALEIKISHSKTDQAGQGVTICIAASYKSVCPVQAFKEYNIIRPKYLGTYFRHLSNLPVTRYQFTFVLKKALPFSGIDGSLYIAHLFKIGAALQQLCLELHMMIFHHMAVGSQMHSKGIFEFLQTFEW